MLATETHKQILIVDRDVASIEPLRQKLGEAGFVVRAITDGSAAATAVAERPPDLLIIEWNMPGLAALEVQNLRRSGAGHVVRVIILSDLSGEEHVVTGLNLGADDYITKPFSLREAVARVCVVLRAHAQQAGHRALCCDELVLDASTHCVMAQGKLIHLRGMEYRLLEFLMSHSGRTFNRSQLLYHVWGGDTEVDERTVDVCVQRLRKILSERGYESYIQTVRGFGYRFASPTMVQ